MPIPRLCQLQVNAASDMLPSLYCQGMGDLLSALLRMQNGRAETQACQRPYLLGLVPFWSLVLGLGLLSVQRLVQHTLQVFVEIALHMQGVISNFHFQAVQGMLLREKKEPSGINRLWGLLGCLLGLLSRIFFAGGVDLDNRYLCRALSDLPL